MRQATTLSIVMPFRNRLLPPFEVALKSLEMQTRQPDEVIIIDIASTAEYSCQMRGLCEKYGVTYIHIDLDLPDKAIDVHLWNTCFNHGAETELLSCGGFVHQRSKRFIHRLIVRKRGSHIRR